VLNRLRLRLDEGDADEVVPRLAEGLLRERGAGWGSPVPVRAVAHPVTGWTYRGFFGERATGRLAPPPDRWEGASPGETAGVDSADWLRRPFEQLPPREGELALLRYSEGLAIAEVAGRLGMTRNAVDQALHRLHRRLREMIAHGT
jgi:hypothetical protein